MKEKIVCGFVVLEGIKIGVSVCKSTSGNYWVTKRALGELGSRLEKVEKKLKKRPHVRQKLLDGKIQPI